MFFMMTKNADKKREQMMMFSMDDMVPQNHMLRLIDKAINWNFIYDLVEEKYCPDNGRPSMDPVMLIKIPFIQYLYGIKSMRQTMKEIEVNVAYRWFFYEKLKKIIYFFRSIFYIFYHFHTDMDHSGKFSFSAAYLLYCLSEDFPSEQKTALPVLPVLSSAQIHG